jgi:hypothetical protein
LANGRGTLRGAGDHWRRFVVEGLQVAGVTACLAEPAKTGAARGPKKRHNTAAGAPVGLRETVRAPVNAH